MAEIPPLKIEVDIDATGVNTGVSKVEQGLSKIESRTKTMTETFGHLKTTMLGVFGGNIATQGIFALEQVLHSAKEEFVSVQESTVRLGVAFDNIGIKSDESRKSILENAEAYTQLGFKGSEAVDAMGTLLTATGSVTQSTKLMAMAADLARYKHIPLNEAAKILARGTQGAARAFKELGITLDTSLPKNKAIAKAFDELNAKIGGQAKAATSTAAVQFEILKEKFQNIFNVIANAVLPIVGAFFSAISGVINWISRNKTPLEFFAGILAVITIRMYAATAATYALNKALGILDVLLYSTIGRVTMVAAAFVYLWNHWTIFRETMAETAATIVYAISSMILAHAKLFAIIGKATHIKFFKDLATDAENVSKKMDKVATSINDLKNKKITMPGLPTGGVKPGEPTGIVGNVPNGDTLKGGGGGGGSSTIQYVTVYASDTNDIAKKMARTAKNGQPIGAK